MRRVIVLRPEPGASETVRRARQSGLDALALPLFEIEPVPWDPPNPAAFGGLLLTSANAVIFGGDGLARLRALPVHAVGAATADAARQSGFTVETIGSGSVDDLLAEIPASLTLLHLCGEHRRPPAVGGRSIFPLVVYRSAALPPPENASVLGGSVALVHSPRAGARLRHIVDAAQVDPAEVAIAAISPAAVAAAGAGWARLETAERPTDAALLALAARLCNKP